MMEVLTQDVSASKIGVESSGLKTIPFPENFNSFHTTPPILQERDILWKHVVVSSHTIYFGAQAFDKVSRLVVQLTFEGGSSWAMLQSLLHVWRKEEIGRHAQEALHRSYMPRREGHGSLRLHRSEG